MSESSSPLLVSIADTCAKLGGISRTTVYELVNSGDLVKVKMGSRGFITNESLVAYVERLKTNV